MIEVKHLTKRYGGHTALFDLSFSLESGKIYGLLGPNGAGKSTTMNIITGYIAATSGNVIINGHNILEEPEEAKKCIGYLPEIPPLYPEMTVGEYLTTVAELKKVPAGERTDVIDLVMKEVMLEDRKNSLIRNLSKGYRQRVGIAQALIGGPQIIILDEPTVGLDPRQILEIRALFNKLKKDHTVIISSHILSEIAAVCDEVLIIRSGHLIARGSAENLSTLLKGQKSLTITAEGTQEQLREILKEFPQIRSFELAEENSLQNAVRITIKLDGDCDIRRQLFFRFAEEGCPILEMVQEGLSLEELFLELVEDEKEADTAPV